MLSFIGKDTQCPGHCFSKHYSNQRGVNAVLVGKYFQLQIWCSCEYLQQQDVVCRTDLK